MCTAVVWPVCAKPAVLTASRPVVSKEAILNPGLICLLCRIFRTGIKQKNPEVSGLQDFASVCPFGVVGAEGVEPPTLCL